MTNLQQVKTALEKVIRCKGEIGTRLTNLADELDKQARNIGISKTIFSSTSAVGSALLGVGLFLAPFTGGTSMLFAGLGASGIGLAGYIGTNVTDKIKKKNSVEAAQKAITHYNKACQSLTDEISRLDEKTQQQLQKIKVAEDKDVNADMSKELVEVGLLLRKIKHIENNKLDASIGKELFKDTSIYLLKQAFKVVGSVFIVVSLGFEVYDIKKTSNDLQKKTPHDVAVELRKLVEILENV